ncbi:MAG: CPBP family intramembrane metalloprotease [Xanthomonadaceae bacterium]|nr:CPBP family intramembrane metalloprotease [Xanthomonadaceae bacterium]
MTSQTSKPPDCSEEDQRPSRLGALMKRRPIMFALGFESALAVLALALALIFGLEPWLGIAFSAGALGLSIAATVPIVAAMLALMRFRWAWVEALRRIVEDHLLPLFSNAGPTAIFAVALMAGVGEELLFRGVIQAGVEELFGPIAALAIASLLFGLAHALTAAYFVLTCLMGLYLGWLYQVTGNLLVPIAVHFLYDWIVLFWYLFARQKPA